METALYFPYIEVPNNVWFTQILLYWDAAATIVPPSDSGRVIPSRNMRDLNESGLLTFVSPLPWRQNEILGDVFLSFLEENGWGPPLEARTYARLHRDKVNYSVINELQQRGLAKASKKHGWWEVEESVGNTYMAMLASAIAEHRRAAGEPTSAVTDSVGTLSYMWSPAGSTMDRARQLRCSLIGKLPVPRGAVSPAQLAKFKNEHSEQLQNLRDHLDFRINEVAAIPDAGIRDQSSMILDRQVRREVKDLKKAMESRRWPKIVFLGVAGIAGTAAVTAATVLTGGSALVLGLAVGGGLLAEGAAMYQTADVVRSTRIDDSKPLAYAARVMKLGRA
jgi:hypothetical protein